jgi:hypothetical protein
MSSTNSPTFDSSAVRIFLKQTLLLVRMALGRKSYDVTVGDRNCRKWFRKKLL